ARRADPPVRLDAGGRVQVGREHPVRRGVRRRGDLDHQGDVGRVVDRDLVVEPGGHHDVGDEDPVVAEPESDRPEHVEPEGRRLLEEVGEVAGTPLVLAGSGWWEAPFGRASKTRRPGGAYAAGERRTGSRLSPNYRQRRGRPGATAGSVRPCSTG